jgi:hypothetical protein
MNQRVLDKNRQFEILYNSNEDEQINLENELGQMEADGLSDVESISSDDDDIRSEKTAFECFKALVADPRRWQESLVPDMRSDVILMNKVYNACKTIEACQTALLLPHSNAINEIEQELDI